MMIWFYKIAIFFKYVGKLVDFISNLLGVLIGYLAFRAWAIFSVWTGSWKDTERVQELDILNMDSNQVHGCTRFIQSTTFGRPPRLIMIYNVFIYYCFFFKNFQKFATFPSPALGCCWLPANRSDCTLALC